MIKTLSESFIDELPKQNYNLTRAAEAAGYSKQTARTQQKRIVKKALSDEAKKIETMLEAAKRDDSSGLEAKKFMSEIVGMNKQMLMDRLKTIANQNKDLGAALKVLAPLAKEYGVVLQSDDQSKITVPILNITTRGEELKNVKVANKGSTEPVIET